MNAVRWSEIVDLGYGEHAKIIGDKNLQIYWKVDGFYPYPIQPFLADSMHAEIPLNPSDLLRQLGSNQNISAPPLLSYFRCEPKIPSRADGVRSLLHLLLHRVYVHGPFRLPSSVIFLEQTSIWKVHQPSQILPR